MKKSPKILNEENSISVQKIIVNILNKAGYKSTRLDQDDYIGSSYTFDKDWSDKDGNKYILTVELTYYPPFPNGPYKNNTLSYTIFVARIENKSWLKKLLSKNKTITKNLNFNHKSKYGWGKSVLITLPDTNALESAETQSNKKTIIKQLPSLIKKGEDDLTTRINKMPEPLTLENKLTRTRFKEIVKEVLVEDNEYQAFFQKCLDKAGKSIPEMGTQEKRDFFNKIDSAWKGRGEKKNEDLVGNQHKLDVDDDGEIEASDLAKLRGEVKTDTDRYNNPRKDDGITYKVVDGSKTIDSDLPKSTALKLATKKNGWKIVKESKQPLNEGWFEIITQGALVLSLIAWAFQLKGYSFTPGGFKQVFKDIKKWWNQLKLDKDLVRIVTKMTQDKEIMDAAKEKVLGPRGGQRPQWESNDKFCEFLKQKLGSADYNTLKKFTQGAGYSKDPNSGAWLNQNTYTSKYSKDVKRITGENKNIKEADNYNVNDPWSVVDKKTGKVQKSGLQKAKAADMAKTNKDWEIQMESINEDEKKVWKYKGVLLVDSDFVNFCKGKLPNSELKHAGGGDFFLQTPDGMISFDRTNGSLEGMSGRAHQVSDNQGGKLLALLIKKMGAKIVNES